MQLPSGTACAIRWLSETELPKVPVHVAATGPRTIQAAARHAEGVDLTVGAELDRHALVASRPRGRRHDQSQRRRLHQRRG